MTGLHRFGQWLRYRNFIAKFRTANPNHFEIVEYCNAKFAVSKNNKIEHILLNGKSYDKANIAACQIFANPGAVCIDIGANIGVYSIILSNLCGKSGEIHAFEPVGHIAQRFQFNCLLNGADNIRLNNCVLGEENGHLDMLQIKPGQYRGGTSTLVKNENVVQLDDDAFELHTVEMMTLDSYVKQTGLVKIDFIKIDVEGYEIKVLKGAENTLKKMSPVILMEHDQERLKFIGIDEIDFKNFFHYINYTCYEFQLFGERFILAPFDFDRHIQTNNILAIPRHIELGVDR